MCSSSIDTITNITFGYSECGLGWFGGGLGCFGVFWGGLGCFHGPHQHVKINIFSTKKNNEKAK